VGGKISSPFIITDNKNKECVQYMAKKQKHPEHENLERWLISYADFITLLFATFVVLYALSQVDIKDFKALEDSIRQAFSAPSVMQGAEGLMQNSSDSLLDSSQADSMITPFNDGIYESKI
jgi:Flagellar motor protein